MPLSDEVLRDLDRVAKWHDEEAEREELEAMVTSMTGPQGWHDKISYSDYLDVAKKLKSIGWDNDRIELMLRRLYRAAVYNSSQRGRD